MDPFVLIGKILGDLFGESLRQIYDDLNRRKRLKNPDTKKVDAIVGSARKQGSYCVKCGYDIYSGDKWCAGCGEKLEPYRDIDER